ncbi:MAG: hypothetical protein EPN93_04300 [Spirochaetes bacterium]|nr:MAG: hypothetical protein EPN93_04300 [Spirochaetota bacterium]
MSERKDIQEIREILGGFAAGGRYPDIDRAKLETMFSRFGEPLPPFDPPRERARLNESIDFRSRRSPLFVVTRTRAAFAALLVFGAIAAAYLVVPSVDRPDGTSVQLAYGDTRLVREGKETLLQGGETLLPGDTIVTGEASFADLAYRDEVKIRVKEHARLLISEMIRAAHGVLSSEMELTRGTVLLDFRKLAHGDSARVKTPTSVAGIRGTSFGVSVDRDSVRYEVLDGKIAVVNRPPERLEVPSAAVKSKSADSLRTYLEQSAVVVGQNEICVLDNKDHERLTERIQALLDEKAGAGPVDPVRMKEIAGSASVPRIYKKEFGNPVMLSELRDLSRSSTVRDSAPALKTLKISTVPVTAEILMDGERRGNGAAAVVTTEGMHVIEVRAAGYHPKRIEHSVGAGDALRIDLEKIEVRNFDLAQWLAGSRAAFVLTTGRGMLVSVSRQGRIAAVSEGRLEWEFDCASPVHNQPVSDGELLYVAATDERLIALSLADGSLRWMQRIEGALSPGSRLALTPGRVIAGTAKGYLYSFTSNGWLDWMMALPAPVSSAPAVSGRLIFVPSADGMVYGVDLNLHLVIFKFQAGKTAGASVAVADGKVYAATIHGDVLCYNYERDEIEWRTNVRSPIVTDPLLADNALFVAAAGGEVFRFSLKGQKMWKAVTGNGIESNLQVDGRGIHVLADKAYYILDGAEGSVKWSFVIPSPSSSGVAFTADNVYFGTEGNGIIRLRR